MTDRQSWPEHECNLAVYLILTIVTCGIFNLFWNYQQMQACNDMLGRREFSFVMWILLSIVTCGIYHIIYQYKMASAIVEIQRRLGRPVFDALPLLSVLVTVFGPTTLIVDAIHQHEINKIAIP